MAKFWGGSAKPTAREAAKSAQRETKKEVRTNQRQMDREVRDLERQEKALLGDIKARARANGVNPQTDTALKAMAKQLVNVRRQREKLYETKAHLSAVGMQASAMSSQVAAASAMGSVAAAMGSANAAMDSHAMAKIVADFTRQNETAKVKEEMMDDALVDAFDTDDVEDEADAVTSQVLAELGVEMDGKMAGLSAPAGTIHATQNKEEEDAFMDALPDLKARLDAL